MKWIKKSFNPVHPSKPFKENLETWMYRFFVLAFITFLAVMFVLAFAFI